ncbi:MAG: flagellar biosynthetic protein FliP [Candidatus Omnitrophota bacterium]|nr:MAG: flagellar biosynthetic protein FliP [Candidatus Omnitrophota bacterium]
MRSILSRRRWIAILGLALLLLVSAITARDTSAQQIPTFGFGPDEDPHPQDVSITLQILFGLTILSLLPSILVMTTSFIRISIVLGMVRRAIGTQQTPSNEVIIGLSLFMTFYVMTPVFEQINNDAIQPYLRKEIKALEPGDVDAFGRPVTERIPPFYVMLQRALKPVRNFMWAQIGEKGAYDVMIFMTMARMQKPNNPSDVPTHVLIPAFMISELKKAFMMGFIVFIPFLILDIVTSSVLISMGMFQLPPAFISLPFKILLFVLVDGWSILIQNLGLSFFQNMEGL